MYSSVSRALFSALNDIFYGATRGLLKNAIGEMKMKALALVRIFIKFWNFIYKSKFE